MNSFFFLFFFIIMRLFSLSCVSFSLKLRIYFAQQQAMMLTPLPFVSHHAMIIFIQSSPHPQFLVQSQASQYLIFHQSVMCFEKHQLDSLSTSTHLGRNPLLQRSNRLLAAHSSVPAQAPTRQVDVPPHLTRPLQCCTLH